MAETSRAQDKNTKKRDSPSLVRLSIPRLCSPQPTAYPLSSCVSSLLVTNPSLLPTLTYPHSPSHPPLPTPAALLTPAQAEKALADEPAPEAASDGHVGLPGLGEHPAERGQEEEVQEGSHQRAYNLGRQGPRGPGSRALTHPLVYVATDGKNLVPDD